ncbi:hypothetical protein Ahy_A03g010472 isoform D [Arachis hypogaea]|uniref:FAD-binding PCMH-type domain-containing protein n=1 Tax=Arachis hypogaea TaxID=3818 RepID=A0A445DMN6_ARAHY|nr:hypothetical protein Ahy_A03g010472 isoform D [Arachis hypogaea]
MKNLSLKFIVAITIGFVFSCASDIHENFLKCLHFHNSTSISNVVYTKSSSAYDSLLHFSIQNLRFSSNNIPKPLVIVTPLQPCHVQATVICSQRHGLQIRIRSGGHDFEGISYVSQVPFVIIDFINYRNIQVDLQDRTAWVQVGATVGELYYSIATKTSTLAFPAGVCPTVGVAGQFSGGGYGYLLRKYGLAADNIMDAHIIDVKGRFLDREAMAKSDYVKHPIPESGLEGLWRLFYEDGGKGVLMVIFPFGGRMGEIPESEIPFPHRAGVLYQIQYAVHWEEKGDEVAQRHIHWIRKLYSYMEPFVSKSPREAYLNYRDLDIGVNNIHGYTSYEQASIWGFKYFKNNFNRLAHVKSKVDPLNFFRYEQSIPSLM